MKYFPIIPFFFFSVIVIAQVPPKQGSAGQQTGYIGGDMTPLYKGRRSGDKGTGYYQKDGKYGFVYQDGVKQPAIYNKINPGSNGFVIKKGELYGIADRKGNVIGKIEYDSIGATYESAYIVKKNGKYGTISEEGNKILSLKYNKVLSINNFVSFVQASNGNVQMIFNEQEKLFSPKIEYAAVYNNLVVIKSNGKFGVVNKHLVVPLEYDSIFVSSMETNSLETRATRAKRITKRDSPIDKFGDLIPGTLLTLQKNNKYGLADSEGAIIFTADNDAIYNMRAYRYYSVKKGNLYGIYFTENKKKTGIEFEKVYADGIGYVMATKNNKAGVFDLQGKQIVAFEYDPEFIMQYSMGFGIKKNKKKGIVGKNGETLVPPIYDDVDPFYGNGLGEFVKVNANEKFGIVNLKGEIIIPVEFEWIGEEKGLLKVMTPGRRFGLYEKTGKVVIPAEYQWITDSDTENSNLIILKKEDNSYNFLNKNTKQVLLKENISAYGYLHNQDGLLNPFTSTDKHLLFVKGKNGKFGMLNENTGALDIPITYDDIIQRFEVRKSNYFSVKSGKKYGLIDDTNRQIIPLQYDAISIDMMYPDAGTQSNPTYSVVVAKGNRFGTINLDNQIQIPIQYSGLQRISRTGLYKAKIGGHYQIINTKNEIISKGPFDEVANFERTGEANDRSLPRYQALAFYKGKMRVIDDKGTFITPEVAMQPHAGYKTFEELKGALVKALDSEDEILLKDFAAKIAPSEHILFYLKESMFSKETLQYTNINSVKEKYLKVLLNFKLRYWKNKDSGLAYNRASLTGVTDYTLYKKDYVTNERSTDHAFGDTRFMEKVLRNAYKINGYWISSFFMLRHFDRFEL